MEFEPSKTTMTSSAAPAGAAVIATPREVRKIGKILRMGSSLLGKKCLHVSSRRPVGMGLVNDPGRRRRASGAAPGPGGIRHRNISVKSASIGRCPVRFMAPRSWWPSRSSSTRHWKSFPQATDAAAAFQGIGDPWRRRPRAEGLHPARAGGRLPDHGCHRRGPRASGGAGPDRGQAPGSRRGQRHPPDPGPGPDNPRRRRGVSRESRPRSPADRPRRASPPGAACGCAPRAG